MEIKKLKKEYICHKCPFYDTNYCSGKDSCIHDDENEVLLSDVDLPYNKKMGLQDTITLVLVLSFIISTVSFAVYRILLDI